MSGGLEAVRTALVAHSPLIALVPATKIIGDDAVPGDIAYPAITLAMVSQVNLHTISPGTHRNVRERVQVTIYAKTRPSRKAIADAVLNAGSYKAPTVSGISGVTIHPDSAGPDFLGDDNARITSQDFIVHYTKAL